MTSTLNLPLADRDVRQRDLVPRMRLAQCHAVVIGVGAVGRQVALQLAAIGAPRLTLYDHDTVGVENLASQGYWQADVGAEKVFATRQLCLHINPDLEIVAVAERYRRSNVRDFKVDGDLAVFACVDSISTRKLIWESVRERAAFFVDGRMSAEVIRVLAVPSPGEESHYPTTLFAPEEAHTGSCTAKATIYTANVAAGLMLAQFTRWLRGLPVDADVSLNLLSTEMAVKA
jgi:sulfur carrier protein ThiS adenylyltransferase